MACLPISPEVVALAVVLTAPRLIAEIRNGWQSE
jgi:hypothetical protein